MIRFVPALIIIAFLAGCSGNAHNTAASAAPASTAQAYSPLANGREIFTIGRNVEGHPMVAEQRPLRPSCAACHGANGAGGLHIADHAISADLRHRALVTEQHPPYTLALLERAISTGIDNTDQPLNPVMPRWKMSQRDLHDVAEYVLKQL